MAIVVLLIERLNNKHSLYCSTIFVQRAINGPLAALIA